MRNQLSDATQRRSRDIAPSIFLKSLTATRHFSMSSIPHPPETSELQIPNSRFKNPKAAPRPIENRHSESDGHGGGSFLAPSNRKIRLDEIW
jgi:hypothetical protein